ncbi:hypothetical protein D1AOALGA4SA_3836 [Olavius algarvensis Delta 1 endosymbiont]|nr:hypothetical protein D1AOALGA4SA_3836 [Olavius algarvensis Delta 1 endosymbiont]
MFPYSQKPIEFLPSIFDIHFSTFDIFFFSFVGWVEFTLFFVGFRCTQPNLHFTGVFAKFETQLWSISVPNLEPMNL